MWKRTISLKIYLWNKTRSGACAAPVPRTRGIAPGPNLRRRRLLLHSSFRMVLGGTVVQGLTQPLYHRRQGDSPCTRSAKNKTDTQTVFRMLLEERTKQGTTRPLYPCGRAIRPAPILRWREIHNPRFLPHVGWGTKESAHTTGRPTGVMKTKKKPGEKARFLLRPFLLFSPDAKHPVGGVSHRPARGRQCRSHLAKLQSTFFKRVSAWHRCRSQLAKHNLSPESMYAYFFAAPAHCLQNEDCKFGTGSRGNAPCGVQG